MKKQHITVERLAAVLSNFLDVVIPTSVIIPTVEMSNIGMVDVDFLEQKDINIVLPEGPKQHFFNRAVRLKQYDTVLAAIAVNEDHCQDHFPGFPMLPMAVLGQMMAQVASMIILTPEENNDGLASGFEQNTRALTSSVESIKSFTPHVGGVRKYFIVPNERILVIAKMIGGRGTVFNFLISVYVDDGKTNEMELTDTSIPRQLFERMYSRQGVQGHIDHP